MVKYYQQPLSELAKSTDNVDKDGIKSSYLEYLGFQHPCNSKFFLALSEEDRNYMLSYLNSGKGCFPYESATSFHSLASVPENGEFWSIKKFYSILRDEGIPLKEW